MVINKTISVWLVMKDGPNKGKVALQKRIVSEGSFPFVCQATWSGGVEPGEEVIDAVKRECKEELGEEFCLKFDFSILGFFGKSDFFRKSKNSIWECHHYDGKISEDILKFAELHKDAFPEFIFVGGKDQFFPLVSGKNSKENIVLFDDQYEVLKQILNKNGN